MSWNHRVIRRDYLGEVIFYIAECYYDETGECWGVTEDPIAPIGNTVDDLRVELEWMLDATKMVALDYDDLPKGKK